MKTGETVTFGGGPLVADGGPIEIDGRPSWSALGVTLVEGIAFINPDQNNGQQPGTSSLPLSEEFARSHEGDGLTIRPGEEWFYVMSVSAPAPGTYRIGPVTIAYRSEGELHHAVTPTNMTLKVSER